MNTKRLKECKNFGELYEAIGERRFGIVAYALMLVMICAPLIAGVINFKMLADYFAMKYYYEAYNFNYKCITLWFFIFTLMFLWVLIFFLGKIQLNAWTLKSLFGTIKDKQRWLLWWIALAVWSIIPIACSIDPMGAIWGISQLAGGYITHIYMFGVLGIAYMMGASELKEKTIWAFIAISDILAVIMLAFEYDIPFLKRFTAATGVSTYTNSNHYGYIIVMAVIAVIGMYYKELEDERNILKRAFCIVSIIINAYALMINDTLGAYLAIVFTAFVLLIMWGIYTGRFKIAYLIPILIIAIFTILSFEGIITSKLGSTIGPSLVVFFQDLFKVSQKSEGYRHAGTDRIGLWIDTVKKIMERPILGYGPDIVVDRDNNYIIWNTPHNEFLECAFFLGIPGLVLYLGGLISLCVAKLRRFKALSMYEMVAGGVVIGYLASSFFGVRKFNTVCYFFLFIGILARNENLKKN